MPRQARVAPPGYVYHVINRTAGKHIMLREDEDFAAFERIMLQAYEREPLPILAWCPMGNHWHFVVRPTKEGQMSRFFRWLTLTHAMRWRVAHRNVGAGHLYRGRFKAFPVQTGGHLLEVLRYVERNALSADLTKRAQDWRWGSLWVRQEGPKPLRELLAEWPGGRPRGWVNYVNQALTAKELARLTTSENRSRPYGDDAWTGRTAGKLGLEYTIRDPWRPTTGGKERTKDRGSAKK